MKNLSTALLVALSLMSLAGCKKQRYAEEAIAKLGELKDQMCKCADKACAEKVSVEMNQWNQGMAKAAGGENGISQEDSKKMAAISDQMTTCKTKAMKGAVDEALAKMGELKDRLCKCADKPCAEKLTQEMSQWRQLAQDELALGEQDTKKMIAISDEMVKCAVRATQGGAGEAIAKMGGFKDSMCKCADKACAEKVTVEMTQWGQEMAKTAGDRAAAVTEEDTKKMAAITEEMTSCMTKIMTRAAR